MADTGRTVWADGLWADDFWAAGLWAADEAVEVPNVVGETQAAGTATLEGDGFVVAVNTAYSDSVAAGLIISQSPAGGSFAASGSTVTITVSLGPQPQADEQPTGGWLFLNSYERQLQRRREEERKRQELEEATEQIEDQLDRQIAQLLRAQEAKDEKRAYLERLRALAEQDANIEAAKRYSERVAKAYEAALKKGTTKALADLDRAMKKARAEEEEFLMLAASLLLQ